MCTSMYALLSMYYASFIRVIVCIVCIEVIVCTVCTGVLIWAKLSTRLMHYLGCKKKKTKPEPIPTPLPIW